MIQRYSIEGSTARDIARSVERGIRTGRLAPEERLPPIRTSAEALGTSPATVAAAYRQLRDRGLVVAAGRRGTIVAAPPTNVAQWAPPVPAGVVDLRTGRPDLALLPDLAPALGSLRIDDLPAGRGHGADQELLELARGHLAGDGLPTDAIAVVSSALDGIERALATRLVRGDAVAVEDPCYPALRDLLPALGLRILPAPVDDEGLVPSGLAAACAAGAAAVVVTPRAQNPTGAALSPARARELRGVLATKGLLVVEDDHAAMVAGAPAVALGPTSGGPWATVRSVSKSLNPDLRVAVLTGDPETVDRLRRRQAVGPGWVSALLQRTVARLWSDPGAMRRVEEAQVAYGERRLAVIDALARHGIPAHGASGLNVWVPVHEESGAVERLLGAGWAVSAGERFRLRTPPGLRITSAQLPAERAGALAQALADAQDGSCGVGGY